MAGRNDRVAGPGKGGGCNCTALRKASRRISQLYDTALAPSGLKTTQRAIEYPALSFGDAPRDLDRAAPGAHAMPEDMRRELRRFGLL